MGIVISILILLILYTYIGYFLFVLAMGRAFRKKVIKVNIEPHVTMMIAAYNEEAGIAKKLEESLGLDYPNNKIRIVVVSDASSDRTDEIVKSYATRGVELIRVEGRVGKTEARNVALSSIQGEIILFSDATTVYKKDVIRKLVRNFADPEVGMVTGRLIYQDPGQTQVGDGQKLYWKYETLIKKAQTEMGTLTGSVGCLSAFRKNLYTPLPANIIEDFTGPLMFVIKGYRVVYEEEAICYEETTKKTKSEWNMRVRVIRGGMKGMLHAKKILNPIKYPVPFFQLLSHKILRWLVPVLLFGLLFSTSVMAYLSPELSYPHFLLWGQLIFYMVGTISYVLERMGTRVPLVGIPLYFIVLNAASFVALIKTMTSELEATWEPQREL